MAKIHCVLQRLDGESTRAFKTRCGNVLQHVVEVGDCGFAVGRMTLTPKGLSADMQWGLMHETLPSDTCVVASYMQEEARQALHGFDESALSAAPRNPEAGRLKGVFRTQFEQHSALNGQVFDVLQEIDAASARFDEEVLPMFEIRFDSRVVIEAWPEELTGKEVEAFVKSVRESMRERLAEV